MFNNNIIKIDKEEILIRDIFYEILKVIERKEIFVIKGPRQSGKTTLLKILEFYYKKKKYEVIFLNFEDPDILEGFEKNPKEYIKSFILKKKKYVFLMDEYHYVKEHGKKLKLLFDIFKGVKFIATGSSSLEIKYSLGKYLVGRVFSFELLPFNFYEFLRFKNERLARVYLQKRENLISFLNKGTKKIDLSDIFIREFLPYFNEYAVYGGYPEVVKENNSEIKRMILKNIYDTYISKDVIGFLKYDDPFKYRCLIKVLSVLIGKLLNYKELQDSCNIHFRELKRLISMLEETYIIERILPFFRNPVTEIRKNPKIYFFDTGLRNYVYGNFENIYERPDKGEIVENFVFLELKNIFKDYSINFYRTIAKAEVDFVVSSGSRILPVEVKFKSFKKPEITKGFINFIKKYNPEKALIVTKDYLNKIKINNTQVIFYPVFFI